MYAFLLAITLILCICTVDSAAQGGTSKYVGLIAGLIGFIVLMLIGKIGMKDSNQLK